MPLRFATALVLTLLVAPGAHAFTWKLRGGVNKCEEPEVFFSAAHNPTVPTPCCQRPPGLCPGGVACVGSTCAAPYQTVACTPTPATDRPNIILFVVDDEGYCHFGFMGPGCRTSTTGRAVPVPATPNFDALALQPGNEGRGRIFEVAHSSTPWSLPSRTSLEAGALPKDYSDPFFQKRFIAQVLKQPDGPTYCSFAGGGKLGKLSEAQLGFDAFQNGKGLGKNGCAPAACAPNCDAPPSCGADIAGGVGVQQADVFRFIGNMLLGSRTGGALDPSVTYTMAQPFFMWFGSVLPHTPHKPPTFIENPVHVPFPGATDYLFGQSFLNPGQPRFPFGAPRYAADFSKTEHDFPGYYGMIWWGDDGMHQLRQYLEGIKVWDATGTVQQTMWDRTVVIVMSDNGENLPRSKHAFTENGHRNPILVYDGGRAASATDDPRVSQEIAHAVDVLPTVVDFGGHPVPAGLPGYSLKPYLSSTPPATPLRTVLCGHQARSSQGLGAGRYALTRQGAVGRCAPPGGTSCVADAGCAAGQVCLLGTCASGNLCLEDDDCPAGEGCTARTQKWCRYGHDPVLETSVPTPDKQPTTACTTDADCAALCPSADTLNCTCQYRTVKLYVQSDGSHSLMDLFVDPDEPGLSKSLRRKGPQPGDVHIGPTDPARHLHDRLQCCMDHWWVPPITSTGGVTIGDASCTGCEPQYECSRCGDGVVNSNEACDTTNFAGRTCQSQGFSSGALACTASCTLDTSGCVP